VSAFEDEGIRRGVQTGAQADAEHVVQLLCRSIQKFLTIFLIS
jgi:hypothetical protein